MCFSFLRQDWANTITHTIIWRIGVYWAKSSGPLTSDAKVLDRMLTKLLIGWREDRWEDCDMLLDHNIWLVMVIIDEHSHLLLWVTGWVVATTSADTSLRLSLMISVIIKVYHGNILLHEGLLGCFIILHKLIVYMCTTFRHGLDVCLILPVSPRYLFLGASGIRICA